MALGQRRRSKTGISLESGFATYCRTLRHAKRNRGVLHRFAAFPGAGYQFWPRTTIGIDREKVTRSLIAGGVGIGLLHADTAIQARQGGEVDVICQVRDEVRVMFAFLQSRAQDPLLIAAANLLEAA